MSSSGPRVVDNNNPKENPVTPATIGQFEMYKNNNALKMTAINTLYNTMVTLGLVTDTNLNLLMNNPELLSRTPVVIDGKEWTAFDFVAESLKLLKKNSVFTPAGEIFAGLLQRVSALTEVNARGVASKTWIQRVYEDLVSLDRLNHQTIMSKKMTAEDIKKVIENNLDKVTRGEIALDQALAYQNSVKNRDPKKNPADAQTLALMALAPKVLADLRRARLAADDKHTADPVFLGDKEMVAQTLFMTADALNGHAIDLNRYMTNARYLQTRSAYKTAADAMLLIAAILALTLVFALTAASFGATGIGASLAVHGIIANTTLTAQILYIALDLVSAAVATLAAYMMIDPKAHISGRQDKHSHQTASYDISSYKVSGSLTTFAHKAAAVEEPGIVQSIQNRWKAFGHTK